MRALNFTLLAVLSCIAVIGATPLEVRAPAGAIQVDRRYLYVCLPNNGKWRGSDQTKKK